MAEAICSRGADPRLPRCPPAAAAADALRLSAQPWCEPTELVERDVVSPCWAAAVDVEDEAFGPSADGRRNIPVDPAPRRGDDVFPPEPEPEALLWLVVVDGAPPDKPAEDEDGPRPSAWRLEIDRLKDVVTGLDDDAAVVVVVVGD